MVFSICKCCQHMAGRGEAEANFFQEHFIPRDWQLVYTKLNEGVLVILNGYCNSCYEQLEEAILLPKGLSGDDLLQAIYDTVQTAHPYDKFSEELGYHGNRKERSLFYAHRDKKPQFRRSTEFLNMFHDYDRELVRLWLEKNFPPQKQTEVFRDTGGSLLCSVLRIAKEQGDLDKVGAILDYILPNENESSILKQVELTAYEFDFQPIINYGCEGIYIDCFLKGKFDESGRVSLHVGTIKTLKRDLESAKIMGELCGALLHHESNYVNGNLHRYTPAKQLEMELQLQESKKADAEDDANGGTPAPGC